MGGGRTRLVTHDLCTLQQPPNLTHSVNNSRERWEGQTSRTVGAATDAIGEQRMQSDCSSRSGHNRGTAAETDGS